jgi:hypothetical protein
MVAALFTLCSAMTEDATFALTFDRAVYSTNDDARVSLKLRVNGDKPLDLTFPSAQMYDLVIRNGQPAEVYRWSRGRRFGEMMQTITVRQEKTWEVEVKLALPPGRYTAEGFLTTTGPRRFGATAAFEIK